MNYPNGLKKQQHHSINTHKNRGMSLESDLNLSNEYYRQIDKAYIYKKPTPVQITKVDYPSRDKAMIKEAFFTTPSTTDYNGLYNGYYIDFEAKETKSKTAFALTNIHPHQIEHLKNIDRHHGIAFIIVRFSTLDETYLITIKTFSEYIESTERKSVPIEIFRQNAFLIKDSYQPRIDYLKIVDNLIGGQ